MAATFDPALPSDVDWVRFLLGDTNVADPLLQDETIAAVLSIQKDTAGKRYFAAAECLDFVLSKALSGSQTGVLEKVVGRVRIRLGVEDTYESAIRDKISRLRRLGAEKADSLIMESMGSF